MATLYPCRALPNLNVHMKYYKEDYISDLETQKNIVFGNRKFSTEATENIKEPMTKISCISWTECA